MKLSMLSLLAVATSVQGQTVAQLTLQMRHDLISQALTTRTTIQGDPLTGIKMAPRFSLFAPRSKYPWHSVTSSVFNIGETATQGDPGNCSSAWIHDWVGAYGGVDSLSARRGFLPACFIPRLNPFYIALPVNDVDGHHTLLQAAQFRIPCTKRKIKAR
jgi:hypothetical protein